MRKYLTIAAILAILGSITMLSSFIASSVLAQDTTFSEEYMKQHDGGDRAEYLQELEESDDPSFYVPPVNDASSSATSNNNIPAD